jgi:hypothetical protein
MLKVKEISRFLFLFTFRLSANVSLQHCLVRRLTVLDCIRLFLSQMIKWISWVQKCCQTSFRSKLHGFPTILLVLKKYDITPKFFCLPLISHIFLRTFIKLMICEYYEYFWYNNFMQGSDGLVDKLSASQPRDSGFEPYLGHDHVINISCKNLFAIKLEYIWMQYLICRNVKFIVKQSTFSY